MSIDPPDRGNVVPLLTVSDLERIVRDHGRRLRNFIRRRVGNLADVEDLMQDTCLEALRSLERYQGHSRPETWLFGIALNLVRGHYKRANSRPTLDEEVSADEAQTDMAEDPVQTLERSQEIDRLLSAFERLPKASASVLELVFDESLTYEQAASRLKIPVGTVRSRIARARVLLKNHVEISNTKANP